MTHHDLPTGMIRLHVMRGAASRLWPKADEIARHGDRPAPAAFRPWLKRKIARTHLNDLKGETDP